MLQILRRQSLTQVGLQFLFYIAQRGWYLFSLWSTKAQTGCLIRTMIWVLTHQYDLCFLWIKIVKTSENVLSQWININFSMINRGFFRIHFFQYIPFFFVVICKSKNHFSPMGWNKLDFVKKRHEYIY